MRRVAHPARDRYRAGTGGRSIDRHCSFGNTGISPEERRHVIADGRDRRTVSERHRHGVTVPLGEFGSGRRPPRIGDEAVGVRKSLQARCLPRRQGAPAGRMEPRSGDTGVPHPPTVAPGSWGNGDPSVRRRNHPIARPVHRAPAGRSDGACAPHARTRSVSRRGRHRPSPTQLDSGVPRVLDHLPREHRGVRRRRAGREHAGLLDVLVLEPLGEIARRNATTGIGLLPVPHARQRVVAIMKRDGGSIRPTGISESREHRGFYTRESRNQAATAATRLLADRGPREDRRLGVCAAEKQMRQL